MKWALGVHGGAGNWPQPKHQRALAGIRAATEHGAKLLESKQSALDAVCAVVAMLEDDPLFNAGTGSVLNRLGEAEMDASVMTGHDLNCGGVAALPRVRNPILIARAVMERSGHALLVGEGALRFARSEGFGDYDPITPEARVEYQKALAHSGLGTVGAVALDASGRLAAGTSTGGVLLKVPGRVGDSPLPGAGNYATSAAAVSATGKGELTMRVLAAKVVCDWVAAGHTAQQAVEHVLRVMRASVGGDAGFIAVDHNGTVGIVHGTVYMVHGWCTSQHPEVEARMER
jgi:L-asparaginase / beta-aspartyl-peptidase